MCHLCCEFLLLFKTHNGEKKKIKILAGGGFKHLYNCPIIKFFFFSVKKLCCLPLCLYDSQISNTELCIMPVCPHDCRKGSFAFCPTESGIMGGLKSCELKTSTVLTKPWWLAGRPRLCILVKLPKN